MKINVRADDKGMSFLIPVSVIGRRDESRQRSFRKLMKQIFRPHINKDWIISAYTEAPGKA